MIEAPTATARGLLLVQSQGTTFDVARALSRLSCADRISLSCIYLHDAYGRMGRVLAVRVCVTQAVRVRVTSPSSLDGEAGATCGLPVCASAGRISPRLHVDSQVLIAAPGDATSHLLDQSSATCTGMGTTTSHPASAVRMVNNADCGWERGHPAAQVCPLAWADAAAVLAPQGPWFALPASGVPAQSQASCSKLMADC
jgi:hypothetical protein